MFNDSFGLRSQRPDRVTTTHLDLISTICSLLLPQCAKQRHRLITFVCIIFHFRRMQSFRQPSAPGTVFFAVFVGSDGLVTSGYRPDDVRRARRNGANENSFLKVNELVALYKRLLAFPVMCGRCRSGTGVTGSHYNRDRHRERS